MDLKNFDPNGIGLENAGIFGLPFSADEAQIVLIPAPWGVTVSYGGGTHNGPEAISKASPQIDLFHPSYGGDAWKIGIAMLPLKEWKDAYRQCVSLRKKVKNYIEALSHGKRASEKVQKEINQACEDFRARIERTALMELEKGKLVGLVGGDHSTPLGLIQALAKKYNDFGILHIDAHQDFKEAYEGFTYSHASIMWNVLRIPQVKKLVQVGIRDYTGEDSAIVEQSQGRIRTFYDDENHDKKFSGVTWADIVKDIIDSLPQKVYISFDIDGLEPSLCPHTGTPVPGGLTYNEAMYLLRAVGESGKRVVGFDLNEVNPATGNEWDANVGMRVLWNIAMWAAKSGGRKPLF